MSPKIRRKGRHSLVRVSPKRRTPRRAASATKAVRPKLEVGRKPLHDVVRARRSGKLDSSSRSVKIKQTYYGKDHILRDKTVLEGIGSFAPDVRKRFYQNRRNALRNLGGTKALRVKLSRQLRNSGKRGLRALRYHLVDEVFLLRTHGSHRLLHVTKHTSLFTIRTLVRLLPNTVSSTTRSRWNEIAFRRESWHRDGRL